MNLSSFLRPLLQACLLAGIGALLVPVSVQADGGGRDDDSGRCKARIDELRTRGESRYLPFDAGDVYSQLIIGLRDVRGCTGLGFTFRSQRGGRLHGGRDSLRYRVQSTAGRVSRLDGETIEAPALWQAGGRGGRYEAFAVVPSGQAVKAGDYRDRLVLQLIDRGRVIDERDLELEVEVRAQALISVEGSRDAGYSGSGGGGLHFGEMSTGAERTAFLFLRANASCTLELRSENAGQLRRIGAPKQEAGVPYTVQLAGLPRDLSRRAVSMKAPLGGPGSYQRSMEFSARLGPVEQRLAGEYRDTITVDVIITD
jgi:hypothetical protein